MRGLNARLRTRSLGSLAGSLGGLGGLVCVVLAATLAFGSSVAEPGAASGAALSAVAPLRAEFAQVVQPVLLLPAEETDTYARRLAGALITAQLQLTTPQFVLVVDRNPDVQAALLFWGSLSLGWSLVGATPVSTGLPGRFEHFTTPLGVFDHALENPDFRAEGTKNKNGFRGYGNKGMRVYDFGWVAAPRGWGDGAMGKLRLQMHATDADLAAWRLGSAQSEGCVRIPATLNSFLDQNGLLDEAYDRALGAGQSLWVLRKDRTPHPQAGRYLVVVESERQGRPDWSPLPIKPPVLSTSRRRPG